MIALPTPLAMHLKFMEFYGLREIPGTENNPVIMSWAKDLKLTWVQNDETAWCSLMMNWIAWTLGIEMTWKLTARSWLDVGRNIALEEATLGHMVIFWRISPNSEWGHVGLLAGVEGNDIYVHGGNQSNQANCSPYPKSRLLAVKELSYV